MRGTSNNGECYPNGGAGAHANNAIPPPISSALTKPRPGGCEAALLENVMFASEPRVTRLSQLDAEFSSPIRAAMVASVEAELDRLEAQSDHDELERDLLNTMHKEILAEIDQGDWPVTVAITWEEHG